MNKQKQSRSEKKMGLKSNIVAFVPFLLLLAYSAEGQNIFDITKAGAKPDADVTQIITAEWKKACASSTPSTLLVPKGIYRMTETELAGPCKSSIEFLLEGRLRSYSDYSKGEAIILFDYVDQLTISGGGVIDGNGKLGWEKSGCAKKSSCPNNPTNLKLHAVTNSIVKDITSLDSKNFHVNVHECKNLTLHHLKIIAPDSSPNTDGIHISTSDDIYVLDSRIATGDDCISLGDKLNNIHITGVNCGPGHGISLGSLGKYEKEKDINGIFVKKCIFKGTDNGVRIKTWPNSPVGITATNIQFEDIEMDNVENPIIVTQEYCPHDKCDKKGPSTVKLNNIIFKNIRGTSASPIAVTVVCSKSNPCEGMEFVDINLTGSKGKITSECLNVVPKISGINNPKICSGAAKSILY